ncbi:hypothetical protein E2C01_082808 [Portunus trituberculatus]|uniref:Uncharacterized protein n=1 Tax=Portunus trituberculatus TaxID=210409 RepID=A0A5B7J2V8_PORTR|nr:hypothetical protein [Portunus trituberculatus]
MRLILGTDYTTCQKALHTLHLTTLQVRHQHHLQQFATKLLHHPSHTNLLHLAVTPPPRRSARHHNKLLPIRAGQTDTKTILKILNS